MGTRAKHWLHILLDSGLPGLVFIVAACAGVTYGTASKISADEHVVAVSVAGTASIVAAYRVWNGNRKRNAG